MVQKIFLVTTVLIHFGAMAQAELPIYDSLGVYLAKTEEFMEGEEIIFPNQDGWMMPPTPITTLPVIDSCEGLEPKEAKECMNRYFKNLVKREAQILEALKDSVFYEKIYFRFILDENAQIEKIDAPHESIILEPYRKERLSILLLEAERVLTKAKFSKPAYQGDRAVKISFAIPITFSNPEKKETTKEK